MTYPTNNKTGADNLVAFALAVRAKCLELTATDGELSDLTTTAQSNLVSAINELVTGLANAKDLIAKKTEIDDTKSTAGNVWSASKTATEITTAATTVKNDLLGGAGEAYDTLKELADLIGENETALEAYATKESLATVATSGSYSDLTNKPTIPTVPTVVSAFTNDAGYLTTHQSLDAYATKASLAAVATSGSYNDLSDRPVIPEGAEIDSTLSTTSTNSVQNKVVTAALATKMDTVSLATVATSGSYADLTNKPTIPTVPTKVSAFTNDSGYLTSIADASVTTAKLANTIDLGSI